MDGVEFGRYRLIELLGRGGMGEVWRAFDDQTQRVVAVKVLPAHLADDPQFEQRFRREAFAAAGLASPHVVPIHHFGEIDGRLYVDMRLIEGRDLHQILTEGALPLSQAVSIIEQVASALQAAHRIGLIHRDVKPSNILVGEDDFAYLIDFGIARTAGQTSLTATSGVVGTWAYMAPERLSSDQTDSRADVYALACVLHECLTGAQPFPASSLERQIAAHIAEPPPRPSTVQPTVPTAMDAVIAKGMAKDPDQRFQSVKDLAAAARAAMTTYPDSAPIPRQYPQAPQPPREPFVGQHNPQYHVPSAPPGPKKPGSGRRVAFAAAGAVAVIIAVIAGIALTRSTQSGGDGRQRTAPNSTALANTGPFTGTFTAAVGPLTGQDGKPATGNGDAAAFQTTWRLRSSCGANGCVASAATGGRGPAKDLVFDSVGGRWLTVVTSRRNCGSHDDLEAWQVISLQPQPNGNMTGEWTDVTTSACFRKRTVTLTRSSDTDITKLPDPANLPRRVPSPAEGLHGRYDNAYTYASGKKYLDHLGVRTDCLRSGDRCMSYFVNLEEAGRGSAYVFSSGTWTRNTQFETSCGDGPKQPVTFTEMISLPQPTQDPIGLLTGHGNMDVEGTGKCRSQGLDQTFTRVGE